MRGQPALVALSVLLASLVAGSLATKQVHPGVHLRTHSLDLSQPRKVLTDPAVVAESDLAPMVWMGSERLGFRFGDLHRFDLVKLKLLAQCGSAPLDVLLDGRKIGTITAHDDWREHVVYLPRAGRVLALERRNPGPCPIHVSRVKSTNVIGYSSSLPPGYVLYDPRPYVLPSPLRAPGPATFLEALLLGLALQAVDRFLFGPSNAWRAAGPAVGPLAGAGVVLTFELVDLAGPLRVVYPSATLWIILTTPAVFAWSIARRRELSAAVRHVGTTARRLAKRLPEGVRVAFHRGLDPAPEAGVRITLLAALGAYAAFLVASLPRTPFEWDEVLFLRALTRYDVATHSPHPPGYPLFVVAERLFRWLGAVPVHAPQLAAALGALLAAIFLFLLVRHLGAPGFPAVLAAVLLCSTPAFAFNANVGLSDALATGLTVVAAWSLVRYLEYPRSHREAAAAGVLAALAAGVRPQVVLALVGLAVWALARSMRQRSRTSASFLLAGGAVGAACWVPAILVTGWRRYWSALQHQEYWMGSHETAVRLPRLAFESAVRAWMARPFGTLAASYVLWLLVSVGCWCWWHSGRRRLVVAMLLCGGGYLLVAPWIMAADASVRYALPALPFLATLAAGVVVSSRPTRRFALSTLLIGAVLGMAAWVMPVLAQRAAEDAPVWAGLRWVRESCNPRRTTVFASEVILPHAEYVLGGAGYQIAESNRAGRALASRKVVARILSPAKGTGRPAAFSSSWTSPRMLRLSRGRYLSCAVFVSRWERGSRQSGDP